MSTIFSKLLTSPEELIPSNLTKTQKYSCIVGAVALTAYLSRRKNAKGRENSGVDVKSSKVAVNRQFLQHMRMLLRIMIPKLASVQTVLFLTHTQALLLKTLLSIYVAALEGTIIKEIVSRNVPTFFKLLLKWFLVAIPACFLNSSISYLEKQLSLSFRNRLVQRAYKEYFDNQVYYRVGNLDTRLQNPDHCLTEDITTFTNSVSRLYSDMMKPIFDMILVTMTLIRRAKSIGGNPLPSTLLSLTTIFLTSRILKALSPKFGQLAASESELKAKLRHCHSRIVTNSEEIAFYGGAEIEKGILEGAYKAETSKSKAIYWAKLWYSVVEQYLMKYTWAGAGMLVIAMPILSAKGFDKKGGVASLTQYYMTTKNLTLTGSDALERMFSSYKDVQQLAGYASRVSNIFNVFTDVAGGKYCRESCEAQQEGTLHFGIAKETPFSIIELKGVDVVTPTGDVIVRNMDLLVEPGMHLLITGPNGCGKSSLFRILSGLWPVYGGTLSRPPVTSLYYIPQRPYMSLGNLREQVIYPDTYGTMIRKGITDSDLCDILEKVRLAYIVGREGGWDSTRDWQDVLSGGEKQRIGLARLFYHKPRFALLDECTSAVSMDVEDSIYSLLVSSNISLLTISHRPSLFKHHTHILRFYGGGEWSFDKIDLSKELLTNVGE
ncbi:unnamed protein product [Allacma fusca]|uniref:Uncharacterized protein n=1 Tax=Allacma fusca TaxID=39272 RepID=A0A8J2KGW5_9HEXA|nr:unnamed protein product [Allacma fusca]